MPVSQETVQELRTALGQPGFNLDEDGMVSIMIQLVKDNMDLKGKLQDAERKSQDGVKDMKMGDGGHTK